MPVPWESLAPKTVGAVVGTVGGLAGRAFTEIIRWLNKRTARNREREILNRITRLTRFQETLSKAAIGPSSSASLVTAKAAVENILDQEYKRLPEVLQGQSSLVVRWLLYRPIGFLAGTFHFMFFFNLAIAALTFEQGIARARGHGPLQALRAGRTAEASGLSTHGHFFACFCCFYQLPGAFSFNLDALSA
jgi:hypothetical protein